MKISENGIVRDMTPEEEAYYNSFPIEAPQSVDPVAEGYDAILTYKKGDCVQFNGGIYRLKTERARNIDPTDKTYWENISLSKLINEIEKEIEQ